LAGPGQSPGLAPFTRLPRRSAGFTLLEILVALAVFGFLLVGLSQTMRFGVRAWQSEDRMSKGKTDLASVDWTLRMVLENLAPSEDAVHPSMTGTNATLSGITRLPIPDTALTETPVEAALAVSGDRLVLRWRPYMHGEWLGAPPPPRETELMPGVARLAIAYWRRTGGWTSSWQDPTLPALIRLRLTFAGDNPPRWPDIVVTPELSPP
jgi:general secretion pathway protein J